MRAALLLSVLLLAGCASPDASSPMPTAAPTGASAPALGAATPTSAATAASPSPPPVEPETRLGVVVDETHAFRPGGPSRTTFNVTGAESAVVIHVTSSGPPADGSFQSAVAHFYFPNTTSPFLAELPGQEAHDYTVRQGAHAGMWQIRYDGMGDVTVHIRVTLE